MAHPGSFLLALFVKIAAITIAVSSLLFATKFDKIVSRIRPIKPQFSLIFEIKRACFSLVLLFSPPLSTHRLTHKLEPVTVILLLQPPSCKTRISIASTFAASPFQDPLASHKHPSG